MNNIAKYLLTPATDVQVISMGGEQCLTGEWLRSVSKIQAITVCGDQISTVSCRHLTLMYKLLVTSDTNVQVISDI